MKTVYVTLGEHTIEAQSALTFADLLSVELNSNCMIWRDMLGQTSLTVQLLVPTVNGVEFEQRWFQVLACDQSTVCLRRVEKPATQ